MYKRTDENIIYSVISKYSIWTQVARVVDKYFMVSSVPSFIRFYARRTYFDRRHGAVYRFEKRRFPYIVNYFSSLSHSLFLSFSLPVHCEYFSESICLQYLYYVILHRALLNYVLTLNILKRIFDSLKFRNFSFRNRWLRLFNKTKNKL